MKMLFVLSLLIGSQAWGKWSVSSYNIRNFDKDHVAGATDLAELGKIVRGIKSDVMTFIEVVNVDAFNKMIKENLPGYQGLISSCGGMGKQKLALVYNQKMFEFIAAAEDLTFSSQQNTCGGLRPAFIVTLRERTTKKLKVFVAIHLKAGGAPQAMQVRWGQYQNLKRLMELYRQSDIILMGDFNTTGFNIRDEDYTRFEGLLSMQNFRTVSEQLACTSYWEGTLGNGQHQSSILDHIVMSDSTYRRVEEVTVGAHCATAQCRPATPDALGRTYQNVSDHCPIRVTFK